jgi:hypothetical protein
MPNHVHVLLESDAEWIQNSSSIGLPTCNANFEADMEEFCDDRGGILSPIMKSLKGYTGKEANRLLNRHGAFW